MPKRIKASTRISKELKVKDWEKQRELLIQDIFLDHHNSDLWEKAYAYFFDRINSRFLNPIKWILEKKKHKGEGFSVVALMCIVLELLEAFYQGKVYTTSDRPQPYEYNSSRELFRSFLRKHYPFSQFFKTNKSADGFYANIRCGLLHEAATKETSLIKKNIEGDQFIEFIDNDKSNLIIYRENFHEAILAFIENYKNELFKNTNLKINFIRKLDDICGIRRTYYFAYGSNLEKTRLRDRIKKFHSTAKATLKDYQFCYNKKGIDGTSKANIIPKEHAEVLGVCYEIDKDDLNILDKYEQGYNRQKVQLVLDTDVVAQGSTYISLSLLNDVNPSDGYRSIIVKGAKDWRLDQEYIQEYLGTK